ncbi:MAG: beta-ketoacyl-[acyl-carrier-protein] synthase family protein [Verrucomicrobiota bacterium]
MDRNFPSIVVTGLGAFCAAASDPDKLWSSVLAGKSFASLETFPNGKSFAVSRAPRIENSLPKLLRQADRCAQISYTAAEQAWLQASAGDLKNTERLGLAIGTSRGPIEKLEEGFDQSRHARCKPTALVSASLGSVSGSIAQSLGLQGPTAILSATCASAALAIGWAADQILLGKADLMLAGGADAPLTASILSQLEAAGITGHDSDPTKICRPFALHRTGIVPGEGAAFLVLESLAHAKRRGAVPLARLSGWSCGMDGAGRTDIDPHGAGLARAIRSSLASAGLKPSDIDHINTHGTGTPQNDLGESRAIESVFGSEVPCVSIKPVTGHCMGASPALEAVACIQSLRHQLLPGSPSSTPQDTDCRIRIPAEPVQAPIRHVLSNSSGLWGAHACLVFSRLADCTEADSAL